MKKRGSAIVRGAGGLPFIPLERRGMVVVSNRGQRDRFAALWHDCFQLLWGSSLGGFFVIDLILAERLPRRGLCAIHFSVT
jgi:hypothetical protein